MRTGSLNVTLKLVGALETTPPSAIEVAVILAWANAAEDAKSMSEAAKGASIVRDMIGFLCPA
jgi:hypothetical protein